MKKKQKRLVYTYKMQLLKCRKPGETRMLNGFYDHRVGNMAI